MQDFSNKSNLIKIAALVVFLLLSFYLVYMVSRSREYLNRNAFPEHEKTIIVKYEDVPPVFQDLIRKRIRVFYRGYPVGLVSKVTLSDDQKHILFYIDIAYKHLKLPRNAQFFLESEDLYGARHFTVFYPKNPSSEILEDGDTIMGAGYYDRVDKYLVREIKSGKIGHLISNLNGITDTVQGITGNSAETKGLVSDMRKSGNEVQLILRDIREVLDDPAVRQELKSTIKSSSATLRTINNIMETREFRQVVSQSPELITKTVQNLDSVNKNLTATNQELPRINRTVATTNAEVSTTNCQLSRTNSNLDQINCKIPVIPPIPPDLLPNADNALKRANCLMEELSKVLSQRFLGLRFVFGKPAGSLKKCRQCHQN